MTLKRIRWKKRTFAVTVLFLLCGCDQWPPVVETKHDVEQLPASQKDVRARGLHDTDIPSLERLQELRDLDFYSGCAVEKAPITNHGLSLLANLNLPHLDILALGFCQNITDESLSYVAKMQTVDQLMLMGDSKITDDGMSKLSPMKNLTYLDLRGCPGITDRGLDYLAAQTNLKTILLGGCPNVTPKGVERLQARLPGAIVKKDDAEWNLSKPF